MDGQGYLALARSKSLVASVRSSTLTMDPYEKYDMTFNGAVSYRLASSSPGKYSGQDNGWILSLIYPPLIEFDQSIIKYPNIQPLPWRSLETYLTAQSAGAVEPGAGDGSEQTATASARGGGGGEYIRFVTSSGRPEWAARDACAVTWKAIPKTTQCPLWVISRH